MAFAKHFAKDLELIFINFECPISADATEQAIFAAQFSFADFFIAGNGETAVVALCLFEAANVVVIISVASTIFLVRELGACPAQMVLAIHFGRLFGLVVDCHIVGHARTRIRLLDILVFVEASVLEHCAFSRVSIPIRPANRRVLARALSGTTLPFVLNNNVVSRLALFHF